MIEADGTACYEAKVIRANGISHSARGFISRREAQAWVNEHRRIEHASATKLTSTSSSGNATTSR